MLCRGTGGRASLVDNRMQIFELKPIDAATHDYDIDMKPPYYL